MELADCMEEDWSRTGGIPTWEQLPVLSRHYILSVVGVRLATDHAAVLSWRLVVLVHAHHVLPGRHEVEADGVGTRTHHARQLFVYVPAECYHSNKPFIFTSR